MFVFMNLFADGLVIYIKFNIACEMSYTTRF